MVDFLRGENTSRQHLLNGLASYGRRNLRVYAIALDDKIIRHQASADALKLAHVMSLQLSLSGH
jgi:hypothetical protein